MIIDLLAASTAAFAPGAAVRRGELRWSLVGWFAFGTPATLAGAWVGRRIVGRIGDRVFVLLVEAGLVLAGLLFLAGF